MAKREIRGRLDGQPAGDPGSQTSTIVGARNGHRELGERSHPRSLVATASNLQPRNESQPGLTAPAITRADERQRLARDLHDGVQNELLSLMLRLKLAEEDRDTPPALAATFAALEDHAAAALDSSARSPTGSTRSRSPRTASRKRCAPKRRGHRSR